MVRREFARSDPIPKEMPVAELVMQFPYVKVLNHYGFCDAWITFNGRPAKCGNAARYEYKAGKTKKPHAKSGRYCWSHLILRGLRATKYDEARAERAFAKLQEGQDNEH